MALHFVGFHDGSQLWRAMQIFGVPDFVHVKADFRLLFGGEVDESQDILIFAEKARFGSLGAMREYLEWYEWEHQNDPKWKKELDKLNAVDDSNNFKCHYRPLTGGVPW